MAGKKGCCSPGQRLIQKRLGCSTGSIGTWTDQLTKAGYVRLEEFDLIKHPFCGGKNDGFVYFLSPTVANSGNGSVAESGNGSVAKTGNATVASLSLKVLPEVETHTVANNGNEIDLKELTEGNEREKAAFHSPFAETPKDKGQEIQAFHALYQKLTGYSEIALDMARERQWFEWLQYGITHQHPFTHEDFKLVIKLIREGISNATSNQGAYRRNRGALKLDNLIGDPGRFEQDLAEARTHFGKRTKPATAPKQAVPEPIDPQAKAIADKVLAGDRAAGWRDFNSYRKNQGRRCQLEFFPRRATVFNPTGRSGGKNAGSQKSRIKTVIEHGVSCHLNISKTNRRERSA